MNTGALLLSALLASSFSAGAFAETARLPAPDRAMTAPLMQALSSRHSSREFAPGELPAQTAADLLWASAGVNRPDGRRTAPSALNRQEVDVYLVTAKGAWRYDAAGHALVPAAEGNLLGFIAGTPARRQDFVDTAALSLLYVSDVSKLPGNGETPRRFAAVDAGMAAQNALLYCAAAGLACVPRATMDSEALASALRLKDSQIPVLNIVVGPAKAP